MAAIGEPEPTKYWLSTMPQDIPFDRLVDLAKLRWRIERDYQELKQELGFWRLRRARLARLPPPCHALYRRLRLPHRRTRRPSPLRTVWHPALVGIYPSLRLPTQRRRRSGPNGTYQTRLPPCAAISSSPSPGRYRDALAATRRSAKSAKFPITDAVRLERNPLSYSPDLNPIELGICQAQDPSAQRARALDLCLLVMGTHYVSERTGLDRGCGINRVCFPRAPAKL